MMCGLKPTPNPNGNGNGNGNGKSNGNGNRFVVARCALHDGLRQSGVWSLGEFDVWAKAHT